METAVKTARPGLSGFWRKFPRREAAIILLFAVISVIFTWPLALHLRESVPGEDHKDAWQMVWNLWWARFALEHGQNPLQTDLLFYPQGTSLVLHALNLWNGLVSLPVQWLFGGAAQGAVAGYNFIVLLSFTVGAFGAYRLALWLWGDWRAGLVAGLAYGFSTYNFDHLLGHLNLVSSEFIPFYILFFLKTLVEPARWWRPALLAVLFLVFNTFLELQYVLYLGLFSFITLIYLTLYHLWKKQYRIIGSVLLRAGAIAAIFALVTLPFTIPLVNQIQNNPNAVPERQDTIYSADLLAYFYPSPFHPLWGDALSRAIKPWTATLIEKVVFPGYTLYLLILAGFGVWLRDKFSKTKSSGIISPKLFGPGFWLLIAGFYIVVSFGRRLHINGVEYGPDLPGGLLFDLPVLNVTRVPSRYAVVALLSLGLLAAWGLSKLQRWFTAKRVYTAVMLASFGLLAFELLPAPYPLTTYNVPNFYRNLANDPAQYSILDLPISQYETAYLEAQMEHHKPLAGGYVSRNPAYPPYYGVPVFQQFRNFEATAKPDILPDQPISVDILRYWGVRYVVVHNDLMSQSQRGKILDLAGRLFPTGPVYQAEGLTVFEVTPGNTDNIFFYNPVLYGWYDAEKNGNGEYYRWAKGSEAKLEFWSGQPRHLDLEFSVWSFNEPHNLAVSFNGMPIVGLPDQAELEPQTLKLSLDLKPGQNQLSLKIGGKATRPSDITPGPDNRPLTIAVGKIKIS